MLASIGSGQIIARTGKYGIFPITGTGTTAVGFLILTFLTPDKPLWFLMIAMFVVGLGLGQLMQTLTLAVAGLGRGPRHRRGDQFGDVLPADRWHPRHRDHAVAAVQPAAGQHRQLAGRQADGH